MIGWTGWRDFFGKCVAAAYILLALIFCLLTAPAWAQDNQGHVKCTTVGGPISIGAEKVTVPLKCCPPGMYVADPDHPALDKNGTLICVEET